MPVFTGTAGKDTLTGGGGNDSLYGLAGDDRILTGDGVDYVEGGDGSDQVNGYPTDSSGRYSYYTYSGGKTIYGNGGDDFLFGGTDNDTIFGGDGSDSLYGFRGADRLDGGAGNDDLDGGEGNDSLAGRDGNDDLNGGAGDDSLDAGAGNDTLIAGAGTDSLYGGEGNDTLYSRTIDMPTSFNDGGNYMDGGAGNDILYGGAGDDTLVGGDGTDELYGGAGNDAYYISNQHQYIYDSSGTDTAYVSTSFVKVPSSIEKIVYAKEAQALPYWIDALLPDEAAGLRFADLLGSAKTYSYSFPTSLPTYNTNAKHADGWKSLTSVQQQRVVLALNYVSSVLDLKFEKTLVASAANTIAFSNNDQRNNGTGSSGYANYPDDALWGSDLFLDNSPASPDNPTLRDGTYGALTLIHELGHALGLKHPFGGPNKVTGEIETPPSLSAMEDKTEYTVMSYTDSPAQYYLRYSVLDIAALQYLYGPSKTSRTGNDTYSISTTGNNFIWDGAGTDTLTAASCNQGCTVYLQPGYWGFVGSKASYITSPGQITVNFGSVIENLIGSSYADTLYGNDAANSIDGGAGNDTIDGGLSNDTLTGGTGNDLLTGGAGNDTFNIDAGTDSISDLSNGDTLVVSPGASFTATLSGPFTATSATRNAGVATLSTSGFKVDLTLAQGPSGFSVSNTGAATELIGGPCNDTLLGGSGIDTLTGGAGNDILNGGAGLDTAVYLAKRADYTVVVASDRVTVSSKASATDGTDSLTGIERLRFADSSLALDSNGAAGATAQIIGAALGRGGFANLPIVGVVLAYMDNGGTADSAASLLIQAGVMADLAGGRDNASLLRYVLNNLGLQSSSRLESILNTQGQEAFFKTAVSGYENILNIDLVGLPNVGLAYL